MNATMTLPTTPGTPFEGGIYAGITRGGDGQPAGHLILLPDFPAKDLTWTGAVKWAKELGNDARLPTRFESALLYANCKPEVDAGHWYWTGTPASEGYAWFQLFNYGNQYGTDVSFKARARAVRLIQLTP